MVIRSVFNSGAPRDRGVALRDIARALGSQRLGSRISKVIDDAIVTAVRRGILKNERGTITLLCRSIERYEREFLKDQFLASLGRSWRGRTPATSAFARWLGFARTGPTIAGTVRSLINGLLREGRLESRSDQIRRRPNS